MRLQNGFPSFIKSPISGCLISEVQITESLRSTVITAVSSLLWILPKLNLASLLSSLSCQRLDFSLIIKVQLSPVHHKSLCHAPAAFTPAAIRPVNRYPPDSSQLWLNPLVLTAKNALTTLHWLFTFVQLHGTHLIVLQPFPFALSTATFGWSTQWWFEACTCIPASGGLLPSPIKHDLLLFVPPWCSFSFRTHLV
jgi:hypothetical protein